MHVSGSPPSSALQSAQSGMARALQGMGAAAASIAADGPEPESMVALVVERHAFAANAAVMRAVDDTADSLFDAWA